MTSEPRAFATVDRGTATTAVSLIGRVDGRWRLLGHAAGPRAIEPEALLERTRTRLAAADGDLATAVGLDAAGSGGDLPRVACSTAEPPEIAVVAATRRALAPLAAAASAAGWRVHAVALDGAEILGVATALANPRVSAVLAGSGEPAGGDERSLLPDVASLVAAATQRRPGLIVVLAGGLAAQGGRYEAALDGDRPGPTLLAPAPGADGVPLLELLDGLRAGADDGRRAIVTATTTLADVLDRRIEVLDVGQSAGVRAVAGSGGRTSAAAVPSPAAWAISADAALLPRGFGDAHLDEIIGWLTVPLDRLRTRDRLRELALVPWGDAAGDGALLRLAAARAAVRRLLAATPAIDAGPAPDLVVVAGGAWTVAPAPAIALAAADVVRRAGVRALGHDHAGLLGPLGTIEDAAERRAIIADLRDEVVLPLGSVVMPAGMRAGRSAGRLVVRGDAGETTLDLVPGSLELIDLPPGERAVVDIRFRDPVDVGPRARHVAVEVAGGLAGLLVDLRDVPLHLPDRLERRRDQLAAWQADLWPGIEA